MGVFFAWLGFLFPDVLVMAEISVEPWAIVGESGHVVSLLVADMVLLESGISSVS